MSKKPDQYMQRAIKALVTLRQKVEAVSKTVWKINSLAEISDEEKRKVFEKRLWDIFAYGEYYVEKVLSDLQVVPILASEHLGRLCDWHKKEYKPFVGKIRELVTDLSAHAPTREDVEEEIVDFEHTDLNESGELIYTDSYTRSEIDNYMDEYEERVLWVVEMSIPFRKELAAARAVLAQSRPEGAGQHLSKNQGYEKKQSVKTVFRAIGEAAYNYVHEGFADDWDLLDHWVESGVDIARYDKIVEKPYFNPDEWVANENDFSPIIVNRELGKIPGRILARVHEIYRSFIYGNWMSVIVMSRGLLEYAIVDRKSFLRIEKAYDDTGRLRSLKDLIEMVEKSHPELEAAMTRVRLAGNGVIHAPRAKVERIPPNKHAAKQCVDGIVKIISTLYSA